MNIQQIAACLMQDEVVAYPTEAVFGLGCNPLSESAVRKLLDLKQRPIEKGLILVAPNLHFLQQFIDFSHLSDEQLSRLQAQYDHPITWVVPAKAEVPHFLTGQFLTGQFNSIAVRLCTHPAVKALCEKTGFALTSTSANLTGAPPCRSADAVRSQFGADFPVLDEVVGQAQNPSEIRDLLTNQLFRQG
ncbi:MAG: Sua5/YciO/YrdC/YwlC family protein [Haemophilus parainfluenzae]|nr:Sua5/YciO/YrdC/YwlC family protein [Haemophilus parainfluenzae]